MSDDDSSNPPPATPNPSPERRPGLWERLKRAWNGEAEED